ncbi:hypothetical protein [Kaistella palustris]|uniref:hypothetical protein n=1 Tax=Kaistella palustris TaxID=493376 RepID=UPI0012EB1CD6|nr:hypothetical protein [Kaistella palustris]
MQDNGKGFSVNGVSSGIGLSNIDSRVSFLNARLRRRSNSDGSIYNLTVNVCDLPKT